MIYIKSLYFKMTERLHWTTEKGKTRQPLLVKAEEEKLLSTSTVYVSSLTLKLSYSFFAAPKMKSHIYRLFFTIKNEGREIKRGVFFMMLPGEAAQMMTFSPFSPTPLRLLTKGSLFEWVVLLKAAC